jgi:hypothetical protein
LDLGAEPNAKQRGFPFGTALEFEVSNANRTEVVRPLLSRGADVNSQGGHYGNALQAAGPQQPWTFGK